MRFAALLLALLVATAAHSHDEIDLPELPIPVIDQLFPVDDMTAAFRWADREPLEASGYASDYWKECAMSAVHWRAKWEACQAELRVLRGGGKSSSVPRQASERVSGSGDRFLASVSEEDFDPEDLV